MVAVRIRKINAAGLKRIISALSDQSIRTKLRRIRRRALEQVAHAYYDRLMSEYDLLTIPAPAVSRGFAATKTGGTSGVNTEALRKSISIRHLHQTVHVGVAPTAKNDRGEPLALIAMLGEIGTLRQPARPHFEPAARDIAALSAKKLGLAEIATEEFSR